jgi:peptidoglycan/xylan/chitin deacetylase (PgdA/CDA1 family)
MNSPWPEGVEGAVSLTFDDGLSSQLRLAVPILNDHGLNGTFYINPKGEDWENRLLPWQDVARAGHEIGNHSLTHPCSRGFHNSLDGRCLEGMTLDEITRDIAEAEQRLNYAFGSSPLRSFAYPCYLDYIGEGEGRQSYVPIVARLFVAGRGRGEIPNHPLTCDLSYLWSFPVERMSGAELIGLAEWAAATGRWSILTFHGIHEGHLSVADVDLAALCRFLARHQSRIWTAPVAVVASRIRSWRAPGRAER